MPQGKFCGFPSMWWCKMLLLFQSYHKLMKTSKTSTTCKVDWSCSICAVLSKSCILQTWFTHMKCCWNPTTSHKAEQRRSVVPTSESWWQAVHSAPLLQSSSANVSKTSVSGFTTFLLISEKANSLFAPLSRK